jgi:GAF domain-containing protein
LSMGPQAVAAAAERFTRATTPQELLDQLEGSIVATTDAALLRFEVDGRDVRYAEHRNLHPGMLFAEPIEEVGSRMTNWMKEILETELAAATRTVLLTDPEGVPHLERDIAVRELEACALWTSAVAITVLRGPEAPRGIIVAAWPDRVSREVAARATVLIDQLSTIAGPLLDRLVELEGLRHQVGELEVIRRLIDNVARTPQLQDALDIICRTTSLVTNLDFVAVAETVDNHVIWRALSGAQDSTFLHQRVAVPPHILDEILQHRYEIILDDVRRYPDMTPEIMPLHTREDLRSTVVLPVHVNVRLRALIVASQRHLHTFSDTELSLLHALAGTVATAIAAADARLLDAGDE